MKNSDSKDLSKKDDKSQQNEFNTVKKSADVHIKENKNK